jgi:hypothetical protein
LIDALSFQDPGLSDRFTSSLSCLHAAEYQLQGNPVKGKEAGDRRQEPGGRRQETGGRRQETGDRRQETGDRRQETAESIISVLASDFSISIVT